MSESNLKNKTAQESVWRCAGVFKRGAVFVPLWYVPAGNEFISLRIICCMN